MGQANETINETVKQEMLDEFNRQMTKILSILGPGGKMNETVNETVKQEMLDEFNRQMTKYSLYFRPWWYNE